MTAQGNGGRGSQEGRASVAKDWHMRNNNQRGIVIGPILAVVALLAVLAAAIAAGSGSFNSDTSAISAKAQASAILQYANEVKFAVERVLAKGCTDTQISFENPFVSGYENPNAPSDKSCHVFDVNGGGIVWKKPPQYETTNGGNWFYSGAYDNFFGGRHFGGDLPPSEVADLTMILPDISLELCNEISGLLGGAKYDIGSASLFYKFTGDYFWFSTYETQAPQSCIRATSVSYYESYSSGVVLSIQYHFFKTLITR